MNQSHPSQDFKLIPILFITSRLMLLAALPPEAITNYGDYEHYFKLASLSNDGLLPFLDYWYEFPPLFPFLSIGLYQLTAASTGALHSYVYALAVVMLAFDTGCLILLYRLAHHFWGERIALQSSWVYLALPVSLIYAWRTFDGMTAFWILLALHCLLAAGENWASRRRFSVFSVVALGLRPIGHVDHYANIARQLVGARLSTVVGNQEQPIMLVPPSVLLGLARTSRTVVVSPVCRVERGVPVIWRAGR